MAPTSGCNGCYRNYVNSASKAECCSLPSGDPAGCATLQNLQKAGFPCEVYPGNNYTEFKIRWILQQVQKDAPDIFVPNVSIPAYFASKWIKEAGIPTVGVLHSDDPFHRAIIQEFLQRPECDHLSAIVGVSRLLDDLCQQTCAGRVTVRMIPYGVPVPAGTAARSGEVLRMLYAGQLKERQKRILDVARALCRASRDVPGTEAILYGSGPRRFGIGDPLRRSRWRFHTT
jgi:colanic acid/amylovoran biosynthesis glycosyltransferase